MPLMTQILVLTWNNLYIFPWSSCHGRQLSIMTSLQSAEAYSLIIQSPWYRAPPSKEFALLQMLLFPAALGPITTWYSAGALVMMSLLTQCKPIQTCIGISPLVLATTATDVTGAIDFRPSWKTELFPKSLSDKLSWPLLGRTLSQVIFPCTLPSPLLVRVVSVLLCLVPHSPSPCAKGSIRFFFPWIYLLLSASLYQL